MSEPIELTSRQRRLLLRVILANCVMVITLFVVVGLNSYESRKDVVTAQRAGCERSKLDRADNAAGWTAHNEYIGKVTSAKSVKEDVKRAARKAQGTYRRISVSLTKRSRVSCAKAFPKPSLVYLGTSP